MKLQCAFCVLLLFCCLSKTIVAKIADLQTKKVVDSDPIAKAKIDAETVVIKGIDETTHLKQDVLKDPSRHRLARAIRNFHEERHAPKYDFKSAGLNDSNDFETQPKHKEQTEALPEERALRRSLRVIRRNAKNKMNLMNRNSQVKAKKRRNSIKPRKQVAQAKLHKGNHALRAEPRHPTNGNRRRRNKQSMYRNRYLNGQRQHKRSQRKKNNKRKSTAQKKLKRKNSKNNKNHKKSSNKNNVKNQESSDNNKNMPALDNSDGMQSV